VETKINAVYNAIILSLKKDIERDVEIVIYKYAIGENRMYCQFHMKNGMVIEGVAMAIYGNNQDKARDNARQEALKILILIEQYMLADDLYFEAQCGCGERGVKKPSERG
jgi:hypothetical protein